jgi:glycosyltransferase involved in cell wall biosynthesis
VKLIIQIPCYNEENTLKQVINDLPKVVNGFDQVEYLIIDDGSTDNTVNVARDMGVDYIYQLGTNRGLATAFMLGINFALEKGADVIVNTDGDNQYRGECISNLVIPIVKSQADMVVGCRPIAQHTEFGVIKKVLQIFGSFILRRISKTTVKDAASGFRAISRDVAMRIVIHSRFSYTMESLIQAGINGHRVKSVDIAVNPKTRESRLFSNIPMYIYKSISTMLSMAVYYRPVFIFNTLFTIFMSLSLLLGSRYVYLTYYAVYDESRTYIPSLILIGVLSSAAFISLALSIISDLMTKQRRISEEMLYQLKFSRYKKTSSFKSRK